jgi:hypothetical protein
MFKGIWNRITGKNEGVDTKNKMKLHLDYVKISFDASILHGGELGIGMYDISNNVRLCAKGNVGYMSSAKGERKALEFTLKYASEKNMKRLALFTDNIDLARSDISMFTKSYNFEEVHLTWVPRELNKEADKQSKEGQKSNNVFTGPAANIVEINSGKNVSSDDVNETFKKYSYSQKIQFLKNISKNEHEKEFVRMLEEGTRQDYKFVPGKSVNKLISIARTIIKTEELNPYLIKRMKKIKRVTPRLCYKDFEKEFNKRKPKNLLKAA